MEPIRGIDENLYESVDIYSNASAPPATIQSSNDYNNECPYILHEHGLHLALDDDDNHNDDQSVITNNDNIYQQLTVHRPEVSPISQGPATPTPLVQQPQITPQPTEQIQHYPEILSEAYMNDEIDNDDFTYDDFDESCQSAPTDRNNVDNAIDKKIEEFILNKGNKANPKICSICNKLFRTNYKLRIHMETHSENNAKFICNSEGCTKTFKSKIGLQEHAAKHTGEFNFTCNICHKQFLLRSYFMSHQRIHSDQKIFSCSICPKHFKSKQNLIDHENCHLGLKHFKCPKCQRAFNTKTHLDLHMKSHNNSEEFECSVCNKAFKSKSYLRVHIKTHFDELKNYTCGYCRKNFIQLSDLKIHCKSVHTNERDFCCETCGKTFSRKDSLALHSKTHTSANAFVCDNENCKKSFTRKTTLMNHKKRCFTEGYRK